MGVMNPIGRRNIFDQAATHILVGQCKNESHAWMPASEIIYELKGRIALTNGEMFKVFSGIPSPFHCQFHFQLFENLVYGKYETYWKGCDASTSRAHASSNGSNETV